MYTKEAINHFVNLLRMEQKTVIEYLSTITRSYIIYSELIKNVSLIIPIESNVKIVRENLEPNSVMVISRNEILLKRICTEDNVSVVVADDIDKVEDIEEYTNIFLMENLHTDADDLKEVLIYAKDLNKFNSITVMTSLEKDVIKQLANDLDLNIEKINLKNWRDDTLIIKFKKKG